MTYKFLVIMWTVCLGHCVSLCVNRIPWHLKHATELHTDRTQPQVLTTLL